MTEYAIALGSNMGDRVKVLLGAVAAIDRMGTITAVAALYETEPIGGPDQPPYLNSVVVLEATDEPQEVLEKLQEIEAEAGRRRTTPWGPRTLDLDIVTSDGLAVATETLQIPHPRASVRRFVLEPLAEIWPEADVGGGHSALQALEGVQDQVVEVFAQKWADPGMWPPGT
jgi:2-amino-4-hydroxy-6-hydroxymethyldihydropteridine diphosphokinase